jgi:hypothetical protein
MNYFKSVRVSMSALIGPLACTCYSALIFSALFYVQMAKDFKDGKCKSVKWGASNRVRCHIWRILVNLHVPRTCNIGHMPLNHDTYLISLFL